MCIKKWLALGAAGVAFACAAQGEAATQVQTINYINSVGTLQPVFYFDTTRGTLNSVTLTYTATYNPSYVVRFGQASSSLTATQQFSFTPYVLGYQGAQINGSQTKTITPADLIVSTYSGFSLSGTANLTFSTLTDLAKFGAAGGPAGAVFEFINDFTPPVITSTTGGSLSDPDRSSPLRLSGTLTYNFNAVPEPATWSLLVIGFGAVGATLRQRRRVVLHSY